ncbi:MAG: LamG domain-containing protein, partial [Candidatus Pacearchaeota archaeon]|nr:LamG domain-containing protein [Candidatus Pacearchaeota archaeon]
LSTWIKVNDSQSARVLMVSDSISSGSYTPGIVFSSSSCNIQGYIWPFTTALGPTNICDNNWHHVLLTYNGTNASFYVDSILRSSATGTNSNWGSTITYLFIAHNPGSLPFNGTIDEIRIWNRSMNISEIRQQYYSNLYKYDVDKWNLYINQSNLTSGTYRYQAFVK